MCVAVIWILLVLLNLFMETIYHVCIHFVKQNSFWYLIENGKRSMTENLLPNIIKTVLLCVKKDYKESVNIIRILLLQWIIPNQNVTNIICIYQLNRFCIICRFEVYYSFCSLEIYIERECLFTYCGIWLN